MTAKSIVMMGLLAALSQAYTPLEVAAQGVGNDSTHRCEQAAQRVRAYDRSVIATSGQAAQGQGKREERSIEVAELLRCGALAGTVGAATIRETRLFSDTTTVGALVDPYSALVDSAIVSAVTEVASDRSASVSARLGALRAIWVLRTGKYWVGYDRLLPNGQVVNGIPVAECGSGLVVTATPRLKTGAPPPPGFETTLQRLAERISYDSSEPVAVRTAAFCAAGK